jgi:hypothetical protein
VLRHGTPGLQITFGGTAPVIGTPAQAPLAVKSGDLVLVQLGHNDKSTSATTFRDNLTRLTAQSKALVVRSVRELNLPLAGHLR